MPRTTCSTPPMTSADTAPMRSRPAIRPLNNLSWLCNTTRDDHPKPARSLDRLLLLLHYDRRAIAQHFTHALHDLGGIVAHADYGIGAHLRGVLQHKLEGLFARPFAQFSEQADVAADQGLKAGPQSSNDRARSHGNAPHNS